MRIAICSDLHLWNYDKWGGPVEAGLNKRARDQIKTLQSAINVANQQKCSAFLVLGDIFDKVRPEPQLLAATRETFLTSNAPVILLKGNHDQSSTLLGDHSLRPLLWSADRISVVETPTIVGLRGINLLFVPHRPGKTSQWLPSVLDSLVGGRESAPQSSPASVELVPDPLLLFLHTGISDHKTPEFLQNVDDSIDVDILEDLATKYNIEAIFAGHWHTYRRWTKGERKLPITQCGTLIPHSFGDAGFTNVGRLTIYDSTTKGQETTSIPGPRFYTALDYPKNNSCTNYVRVTSSPADIQGTNSELLRMIEETSLAGGEVIPDTSAQEIARETAIRASQAADSFDIVVRKYIETREFDERVSKKIVLERTLQFLA